MAYIDREQVCENCNNKNYCEREKCPVYKVSAADVVPKSEVEMLQGALKAEEKHNELTMEMAQKALKNAKSEVAREIFEEIENNAFVYGVNFVISKETLAELKKQYTEGEE